MSDSLSITSVNTVEMLKNFNNRDVTAFGYIYSLLYKELYFYTTSLYKSNNNISPEDIIQDVFLSIWEHRHHKFETIVGLRSFLLACIRNQFLKDCRHRKVVERTSEETLKSESQIYAIESEIYSIVPEALKMLPCECAKSFKLFLDGWDVKEIAQKLQKRPSTIYNQRKEAIEILRQKLDKNKLMLIVGLLGL